MQRLFVLLGDLVGHSIRASLAGHAQDFEHQRAVVGDDRPATLRNDIRVRHVLVVAHVADVIHHVVGVLLQRVVDAGREIGLRSIVIDAQAPPTSRYRRPAPRFTSSVYTRTASLSAPFT